MSSIPLSLLDIEDDAPVCLDADDYQKRPGKWCAGCGDFGALNAVKRLLAKEQLRPEKMAFVSGIGEISGPGKLEIQYQETHDPHIRSHPEITVKRKIVYYHLFNPGRKPLDIGSLAPYRAGI